MAKYEVTKTTEAKKLNKRSKLPTGEVVTLPFGAILENRITDGDRETFHYLGEIYQMPTKVFRDTTKRIGSADEIEDAPAPASDTPVAAAFPATAEPEPSGPVLRWETLNSQPVTRRTKVPGGWLIAAPGAGLTFYPDPDHEWDGGSL
jgi:hypothetical protein